MAGKTALQRACELLAPVAEALRVVALGNVPDLRTADLADRWQGEGPWAEFYTALRATANDTNGAGLELDRQL